MKTESILLELETVKEQLSGEAHGDMRLFLDQMDAWLVEHPHAGTVVNSPEELQARMRARQAAEPSPPIGKPYRVHDSVLAGVHRARAAYQESPAEALVLKDEPPRKKP